MGITFRQSQIRTINHDDPNFTIVDDFVTASRAGFNISQGCPKEYRMIILECMNNGWLTPVAHVTEKEYIWMNLSK
jgi:hypothetical protein